jgi:hypothetical protein
VSRRLRIDVDEGKTANAAGELGTDTDDDFDREIVKDRGHVVSEDDLQ